MVSIIRDAISARAAIAFDKQQRDGVKAVMRREKKAISDFQGLLQSLRKSVIAEISRIDTSPSAFNVSRASDALDFAIREFLTDGGLNTLTPAVSDAWGIALDKTDTSWLDVWPGAPPAAADISGISQAQLAALTNYSTAMISSLSDTARAKISPIVRQAATGLLSPREAMTRIGGTIDRGAFKSIAARAEAIVRTEVLRSYSVAQDFRLNQAREAGLTLKKRWDSTRDRRARPSHVAANDQEVPATRSFVVGGQKLRYPRDPRGSASETINCRCVMIAVLPESLFEKPKKPKRPPKLPTAAANIAALKFPSSLDELTYKENLGGSTGAALMVDPQGKKWVLKKGASPAHIESEMSADRAYQALGVKVPRFKRFEINGQPAKLAEFIAGTQLGEIIRTTSTRTPEGLAIIRDIRKKVQAGFAADALLGNWDSVGLAADNIIVTAAGDVVRIDNGGARGYRAQGAAKTSEQWSPHPDELWSMRNEEQSPSAANYFGAGKGAGKRSLGVLGWGGVMSQARSIVANRSTTAPALKRALSAADWANVQARITAFGEIDDLNTTLKADKFRPPYRENFLRHLIGLRSYGIAQMMPKQLRWKRGKNGVVLDENKKEFDDLRGRIGPGYIYQPSPIMSKFDDYLKLPHINGNFAVCDAITRAQGQDSWSGTAVALKHFVMSQIRDVSDDNYFYGKHDKLLKGEVDYDSLVSRNKGANVGESITAYHAFTYTLLSRVRMFRDIGRLGPDIGRIAKRRLTTDQDLHLFRTEHMNQVDPNATLNERAIWKRGPAESTSLFSPVSIGAPHLTLQKVPIHRVLMTYLPSNLTQTGTMLMSNQENEFVAMLEGIEAHWAYQIGSPEAKTQFGNI